MNMHGDLYLESIFKSELGVIQRLMCHEKIAEYRKTKEYEDLLLRIKANMDCLCDMSKIEFEESQIALNKAKTEFFEVATYCLVQICKEHDAQNEDNFEDEEEEEIPRKVIGFR